MPNISIGADNNDTDTSLLEELFKDDNSTDD